MLTDTVLQLTSPALIFPQNSKVLDPTAFMTSPRVRLVYIAYFTLPKPNGILNLLAP